MKTWVLSVAVGAAALVSVLLIVRSTLSTQSAKEKEVQPKSEDETGTAVAVVELLHLRGLFQLSAGRRLARRDRHGCAETAAAHLLPLVPRRLLEQPRLARSVQRRGLLAPATGIREGV